MSQAFEAVYQELDSLYHAGEYEQVLTLADGIMSQIGQREDTLVANAYFYIGDAYLDDYQIEPALTYFTREKELRKKLLPLDPAGYSNSLYNIMFAYLQDGRPQQAIDTGKELLAFDKATYGVNSIEYVQSSGDYFDVLAESGQWAVAVAEAKKLLNFLPRGSGLQGLVEAKLGQLYSYRGLYGKSGRYFAGALLQMEKTYDVASEDYQITLANFGNLLMAQGKYDRAEEILTSSLQTIQQSDWSSRGQLYYTALNNLALTYQFLGQFTQAEKALREVLSNDSITLGTDNPDFAISLSNLGQLYTDQARYTESEAILQQALDILAASGETNTVAYARKLNNQARNYQYRGDPARAVPLLEQALQIFEATLGKNSPEYGTALQNLGIAYLGLNPSTGFAYLKKAELARRKSLGRRHPLYAETLEKMALYQWKKRNKKEVRRLMGLVFENYFNQVSDFFPVLTEEEKSNLFFNTIRPSQELYASWATHEAPEQPAILGELYNITLNTKGLILYATDRVKQKILQQGDSALINLYDTWETQKELLAFYYSSNQEPRRVDSLLQISKSTEKELSRRSSVFSRDIIRPHRQWNEVRAALKPGEAAVEIIRFRNYNIDSTKTSDEVHYAFLLLTAETKEGPRLVLLNEGNLMESKYLSYYRNGIQFKVDDEYTYGFFWQKLHDELKKLKATKVYLSTDGAYNLLSLSAIKNPLTQQYLLEELDIHLVGSTRDLLSPPPPRSIGQSSLLIGYPQYNLHQEGGPGKTPIVQTRVVSRSIRGALTRFLRGTEGIADLPGTKKEVELISRELSKNHQPMVWMESMASEQNLKDATGPDILHIATHGYFLEDDAIHNTPNPLLNSGLILAGATNFIRHGHNPLHAEDDGVLTAYEAMNLDLENTNVVVLSACETGLGTVQNGEGVYGLQRAFQLAGAKHIIMSLWPVDDEATQYLMAGFYQQWAQTQDVREAFKRAQLDTKSKFQASYYWGAFILIGL